jgi:hypothetical protein
VELGSIHKQAAPMTYKTDSRYQLQVQQRQSGMLVLIKKNLQAQRLVSLLPLLAQLTTVCPVCLL